MFFMKISWIIPVFLVSFFLLFSSVSLGYADTTKDANGNTKSPTTTSPTDSKYFDNDLSTNKLIQSNSTLKAYASDPANQAKIQEIMQQENNQCWAKCVDAINTLANTQNSTQNQQISNGTNTSTSSRTASSVNILWQDDNALRSGNVDIDTIPKVIASVIEFVIGIAGTISIFMLIYFSVRMQLSSGIMWDSSWVDKAKKWMFAALIGFLLSISAWFIMARFIDILSASVS